MSRDVVIIGGAMIGSAIAWWLKHLDFDGTITVLERDPSYEFASTSHTNSCIRQQFGTDINIRISQFCAEFIKNIQEFMGADAPALKIDSFGYMYLAATAQTEANLRTAQALQASLGAGTQILTPDQIAAQFPFYNLDGIRIGSHNPINEGYFDGGTIFDLFRRGAQSAGVQFLQAEATGFVRQGQLVTAVDTPKGRIPCGIVVNAAGADAARIANWAGISLPVEHRKRFTWVFQAETPLSRPLPLTIDPTGVHMRSDGRHYMCGCPPTTDLAVDPHDFAPDPDIWMDTVWPALATRVPAFERIRVINEWVGHYAYNTLDQNALLGRHPTCDNLLFANGFSGHGLQQAPAIGRGLAEWIIYGHWRSLDLSPLDVKRIVTNTPLLEPAVI